MEEDIFNRLDIENQHPSFQSLNDEKSIKTVNPSSRINNYSSENQDFEESFIISIVKGFEALTTALKYLE